MFIAAEVGLEILSCGVTVFTVYSVSWQTC